ncbi:MAG: diguanylate cyclase [Candidatus Bipolaricaulia bacterium]
MGDELEGLRRLYLEEVRGALKSLKGLLSELEADPQASGPLTALRERAHRLKGSGGSYGYPRLSELAQEMEEALQIQSQSRPLAALELERLQAILGEMERELQRAEGKPLSGEDDDHPKPAPDEKRPKVAVVDDDPYLLELVGGHLRQAGFATKALQDPTEALAALKEFKPDLLLLDIEMPRLSGLELCVALRHEAEFQKLPVFFLTGRGDVATKVRGLEAGADDYITKPFHPEELIARIAARLERNRVLTELADLDGLTGLYNHRAFQEKLRCILERTKRYERQFSLALLDLDRLKAINDRYGHRMGDAVLKALAELIKSKGRKSDLPARYGGDEFAIIFPESAKPQAVAALTRLQGELHQRPLLAQAQADDERPASVPLVVSFSAGVASFPEDGASPDELLESADRALYRAKGLGGAQVLPAGQTRGDKPRRL